MREEKNDECMKIGLKEEINSIAKIDAHRRRIMNEWIGNYIRPNLSCPILLRNVRLTFF